MRADGCGERFATTPDRRSESNMSIDRQTATSVQVQSQNSQPNSARLFDGYRRHPSAWDELFAGPGEIHEHFAPLMAALADLTATEFQQLRASADLVFINQGITFS